MEFFLTKKIKAMTLLLCFLMMWFSTPNCVYQQKIVDNSPKKSSYPHTIPQNDVDKSKNCEITDSSFFISKKNSILKELQQQITTYYQHHQSEKTYIHIDKTLVEPGESIWFSVYLRDANTLQEAASDVVYLEWLAPNGNAIKKFKLITKDGIAAGDLEVANEAVGGLYTLRAYTNHQRNTNTIFERKIQVQTTYLPNLRLKLEFDRKAYSVGDKVQASFSAQTLEDSALSNFDFQGVVSIDGNEIDTFKSKTDNKGLSKIKFTLPNDLKTTDGLLNILLNYENQNESISRSIPIVLNKIDLQFFPEGGDLVEGISSKLAFKAINEFGKAADVEGKIYDQTGAEVAFFKSYHNGMGATTFTPQGEQYYYAKITKPTGISESYTIPNAQPNGAVLQVEKLEQDKLCVQIKSSKKGSHHLVLQMRGDLVYTKTIELKSYQESLEIPIGDLPIGIAQLTLFDGKQDPQAERLVFVNPHRQLNFNIKTDHKKYQAREKVKMTIEVTNDKNEPVETHFSIAVTDDQLLTFADDKQGHLLSHILLESDLKGKIEEPNFYFDKPELHPEKDQSLALDYLLMTQGWRHFSWKNAESQLLTQQAYALECADIGGRLVNKYGKAVKGATILHYASNQRIMTDKDGRFLFEGVELSRVQIDKGHKTYSGYIHQLGRDLILALDKVNVKGENFEAKVYPKNNNRTIYGKIVDDTTEPLIGASVAIYQNKQIVHGTTTDIDGSFELTNLPTGTYNIEVSYTGFSNSLIENFPIHNFQTTELNVALTEGVQLTEVLVTAYSPRPEKKSLAYSVTTKSGTKKERKKAKRKKDKAINKGGIVSSEQIQTLPTQNINSLAATTAGVAVADGESLTVRGSRSNNTAYYIDGIRIRGQQLVPQSEIAQAQVITGGVPAAFENDVDMLEEEVGRGGVNLEEVIIIDYKIPIIEQDNTTQGRIITADQIQSRPQTSNWTYYQPQSKVYSISVAQKRAVDLQQKGPNYSLYTARNFYVPKYTAQEIPEQRTDFRNTIYWNPKVQTDSNGKATLEFYNSDALTTFKTTIEGFGKQGEIGRATQTYFTQLPFELQAKIPTNLIVNDEVQIPVSLKNNTDEAVTGTLAIDLPDGLALNTEIDNLYHLEANEVKMVYITAKASHEVTDADIAIQFESDTFTDAFKEKISIVSRGYPVQEVYAGNDKKEQFEVNINQVIKGTVDAKFTVYTNLADDFMTGLDRMMRQPTGCFEQTSSANYPNLLVLDYLQQTNQVNPKIERKALDFLKKGYHRLKGYEVKGGGFDWYGKPPAHEPLTAYGLMEFVDMKAVYPVEKELINRTAKWLLSRRNGEGGWKSSKRGLHSWRGESDIANAYIAWAMTEAGMGKEITAEIEHTYKKAIDSNDLYLLSLLANALYNIQDSRLPFVLEKIAKAQEKDGSWMGKTSSMTNSGSTNLRIETTALCALAFLKGNETYTGIDKAIRFLMQSKNAYGFGSTQSTVLAMKALVLHAKQNKTMGYDGQVQLLVNGQVFDKKAFTAEQKEPIVFDLSQKLSEGKHTIEVQFEQNQDALPYDLALNYYTKIPQNTFNCAVNLKTSTNKSSLKIGETVRLSTSLKNTSPQQISSPIAIVGIPSGLSVQAWQLKELQEKEVFDYYELNESNVVFYYRNIPANTEKEVHLDLKADLVGTFESPASSAYLYYTNEWKHWEAPTIVKIEP